MVKVRENGQAENSPIGQLLISNQQLNLESKNVNVLSPLSLQYNSINKHLRRKKNIFIRNMWRVHVFL